MYTKKYSYKMYILSYVYKKYTKDIYWFHQFMKHSSIWQSWFGVSNMHMWPAVGIISRKDRGIVRSISHSCTRVTWVSFMPCTRRVGMRIRLWNVASPSGQYCPLDMYRKTYDGTVVSISHTSKCLPRDEKKTVLKYQTEIIIIIIIIMCVHINR